MGGKCAAGVDHIGSGLLKEVLPEHGFEQSRRKDMALLLVIMMIAGKHTQCLFVFKAERSHILETLTSLTRFVNV